MAAAATLAACRGMLRSGTAHCVKGAAAARAVSKKRAGLEDHMARGAALKTASRQSSAAVPGCGWLRL
jgi:hypothetical protein